MKKAIDSIVAVSDEEVQLSSWLRDDYVFSNKPRGQLTGGKRRAKNYVFIVYPYDLPEELQSTWKQKLVDLGYKIIISPFHDKDVTEDGELKKPHYHVLVIGGNSWVKLDDLIDTVKYEFSGLGVATPQKCSNVKGQIRYFTHMEYPDKYQYKQSDIESYNAASEIVETAFKISDVELADVEIEILEFIRNEDNGIDEYYQLIEVAMDAKAAGEGHWYECVRKHSWMFERYLSSRRNHKKDMAELEKAKANASNIYKT
ncbi:hypothetical protein JDW15_10270 [Aerococcaceae bacterium zg-ZJ1578]|uniref:Rep family protein n=1 Tax=Aerococcaceae bacterium zg-252 TaxID=2796928 RepID=UPI001A343CFA|nr:hypothetical protein [Aerococcaceae bacterium zg-1578]